jgi:hypothetical protein
MQGAEAAASIRRTSEGCKGDGHGVGHQGSDEQAVQRVGLQARQAQHRRDGGQPTDARQAEDGVRWRRHHALQVET